MWLALVSSALSGPTCCPAGIPYYDGPVILGNIDATLVEEAFERVEPAMAACIVTGGVATLKVVVEPDGSVREVTTKRSQLDEDVLTCLHDALAQAEFPEVKGGGIAIISHKWVFSDPVPGTEPPAR